MNFKKIFEIALNETEADGQNKTGKPGNLLYLSIWGNRRLILLIFIPVVSVVYIFYRFRIKHLKDIQNVKNNISADLHDEIGARLTSIRFLSSIAKKKVINNNEVAANLEQIESEIQKSSEALDEIVWNLKVPDKNLEGLFAKMRRYSSKIFEEENMVYRFNIQNTFKGRKMCLQKRRQLFLIFKELMNNLRKHAKATSCKIEITERDKMLFIKFHDNGIGFNPGIKTDRNGLKNIKRRLKKWGGRIEISSSPGAGSLSEIWLPYESRIFRLFNKNIS